LLPVIHTIDRFRGEVRRPRAPSGAGRARRGGKQPRGFSHSKSAHWKEDDGFSYPCSMKLLFGTIFRFQRSARAGQAALFLHVQGEQGNGHAIVIARDHRLLASNREEAFRRSAVVRNRGWFRLYLQPNCRRTLRGPGYVLTVGQSPVSFEFAARTY